MWTVQWRLAFAPMFMPGRVVLEHPHQLSAYHQIHRGRETTQPHRALADAAGDDDTRYARARLCIFVFIYIPILIAPLASKSDHGDRNANPRPWNGESGDTAPLAIG